MKYLLFWGLGTGVVDEEGIRFFSFFWASGLLERPFFVFWEGFVFRS
jgi:hypothetical protein